MDDVKRENVNWPNILGVGESRSEPSYWSLAENVVLNFQSNSSSGCLNFWGTQLWVLWEVLISRAEISFPWSIFHSLASKATEPPQKCRFESWSSHRHLWEAPTVWCKTPHAGGTAPGLLRGGICSPPLLQSINWGVCFSPPGLCCRSPGSGATGASSPVALWSEGRAERPRQRVWLGMRSEGPRQDGVPSSNHVVMMQVNLFPDFFVLMGL